MAKRPREKPALSGADEDGVTIWSPPNAERAEQAAKEQPGSEGTLMIMGPLARPEPAQRNPGPLAQTMLVQGAPHRGPQGSAPHVIPGSQPPPGYAIPGSQPHPGSQPPQGHPGLQPQGHPGVQPQAHPGQPHVPPNLQWGPATGGAARPGPAPLAGPPPILLQGDPDSRLVLITEPDSARAASFRVLRDNLLAKRLPRVLAVTSAAKSDGKTTCSVNLALSLSEGARVLLLDGNLIDPDLDKIFCINESTPVPPANAWLAPYTLAAFSRGLHVAALVLRQGQAAPRFEKQWFEQLIGSLRRLNYDFVIIDAAALSASPTVSHLVATADATLLAVRSGATTARALRRATDQIPEAKRIGLALIDAKSTP